MDKNSVSDFNLKNISNNNMTGGFDNDYENSENAKKNIQSEVLKKKNKEFTSKFDIPLQDDGKNDAIISDDETSDVTHASDISNDSKPSQIIQNPSDNIRYMKKRESAAEKKKKLKAQYFNQYIKKNTSQDKKISSEISGFFSEKRNKITDIFSNIISQVNADKEQRKKRKRGNERLQIDIKSTPDIDFFSMTFNELQQNPVEPVSFSDDVNYKSSADHAPEIKSHIEDFEKPEDAESVISDMYELQTTLHSRIITLLTLTLMCTYISFADTNNFPIFNALKSSVSPQGFIFVQIIMLIIGTACSFTVISGGIKKFFRKNADCDSMTAMTVISCLIASLTMLVNTEMLEKGLLHIYAPIGIASLLFNAIGKYLIVDRAICSFDFVSDTKQEKYAMFCIDDENRAEKLTRGFSDDYPVVAASRKTDFLSDFLKYTYSSDISDKFCKYSVPVFSLISALAALIMPVINISRYSGNFIPAFFSVFSMCMSLCSCFAIFLIVNLPLNSVAKEYAKTSGLMLGYQSVEDFYDANAIITDAIKLFPEESVMLHKIKMFSNAKIDDAIIYAGSLAVHSESILSNMFMRIADGKQNIYKNASNCIYEDGKGLCGWIDNRRILLGNRYLMETHSIENIPSVSVENEYTAKGLDVVYVSISGNLAAMFVIKVKANPEMKYWLSEMAESKIKLIIKTNDALVTSEKLSSLFGISQEYFRIAPSECYSDFDIEQKKAAKTSASMAHDGSLSTMIKLITDSRNLRRNFVAGISMQCAATILGLILAIIFICMGAAQYFSPFMILIYNLAWTAVISILVRTRIF